MQQIDNTFGAFGMGADRRLRVTTAACFAGLLALTQPALGNGHRVHGANRVIVTFKNAPSTAEIVTLKRQGFDVQRHLDLIHAVAGTVPASKVTTIRSLPGVRSVVVDQSVRKTDAFTVNSSLAGAAYTQYGSLGTGIGVAVLDSGVTNVADFEALPGQPGGTRLKTAVDFTGLGPNDQCGHGTHVAGIIAGDGKQSSDKNDTQTFYGTAPGASLVSVRVLDQQGSGSVSNVIAGIQWVVTNRAKYNLRVLNISLGHPVTQSYTKDPLNLAVEAAWKAGIVVVCAAGNDGRTNAYQTNGLDNEGWGTAYGSIECPGNDPYVITVGATKSIDGKRADDQIATYSSRGPTAADLILKPDIVAPGNKVISTEATGKPYLVSAFGSIVQIKDSVYMSKGSLTNMSAQYMMLSGTSMAVPVVSGAVAMMLQKQPNLTPDTVKARLMLSADKWVQPDATADACTFGAGYLNVSAAMASTVVALKPALSPLLLQSVNNTWYVQTDLGTDGQRALWGTGIIPQKFYGRAMWGTGFTELNATRAMWGNSFNILNASSAGANGGIDCTTKSVLIKGE